MEILTSIEKVRETLAPLRKEEKTIGFVPTMGYLHEGHLSLIEKAKAENDYVIISIFVNPLQFGPNEDFDTYPRDFKRDEALAEKTGVDFIFYPSVEEMYPQQMAMKIVVEEGVDVLCGKSRPGHFDGVATVVLKLFNIVSPTKAYFGMKDAQQVAVIEKLVRDFNLPLEIVPCPTLREEDGLAKSSRNVNLTEQERKEAPFIYKSLQLAEKLIHEGEKDVQVIKETISQLLLENMNGTIDYVEVLSYPELKPISHLEGKIIIAIAYKYSKARLIDNIVLTCNI